MCRPLFLPCDEADSLGLKGRVPKNSQIGGPPSSILLHYAMFKRSENQVKVGWAYMLQLATVDSKFLRDLLFKIFQGSYSSDSSNNQDFEGIELLY